jgi:Cu+-exporting ATPase
MDRRKFLTHAVGTTAGIGLAGAGALAINQLSHTGPEENQSVTYKVKGFTCVTCATGLEVMLMRRPGVARASASYPDATVVIGFNQNLISETVLKEFITDCGFSVS